MPFAEEWKPYRYSSNVNIETSQQAEAAGLKNIFKPIRPGTKFYGDRVYYVVDQKNVVVPIRINANTEIARFNPLVPTGSVDIVGISWQYSAGTPGLEWERERYMMQVWPRHFSDVGVKWTPPKPPSPPVINEEDRDPDVPVTPPFDGPSTPTPPTRLPDITINLGDSIPLTNINSLGCGRLNQFISSNNDAIKRTGSNEPLQGCDALQPNQEQYIVVESDIWYGLTRTFYFRKDKDGNCTCLLVPKGTNLQTSRNM
jgi:hypothetical protein